MFGRLHYTPNEYYRMGWADLMAAVDGFSDSETAELNRLRHIMWAPIAAMGGKVTPKQLIPLPSIDGAVGFKSTMSKEQFLQLAKRYKNK
jgi:hypothetical protein